MNHPSPSSVSGRLMWSKLSNLGGVFGLLSGMCCVAFSGCAPAGRRSRCSRVICSLQQRGCGEPSKDHCRQESPRENDWFPWNKNEESHTNSGDEGGDQLPLIIGRRSGSNHLLDCFFFLAPARAYESARFRSADKSLLRRDVYRNV